MKRLVQFLLFAVWLVGAVTGGLTVQPDDPPTPATAAVADVDRSGLRVQEDRIVMAVHMGENRWRLVAPVPASVASWLRDVVEPTAPARRTPAQDASLIPL
jgi:hypothetical protein